MSRLLQSIAALAFFIGLYAVPEIPLTEPMNVGAGQNVTIVENGRECKYWTAEMYSNQKPKKVCS